VAQARNLSGGERGLIRQGRWRGPRLSSAVRLVTSAGLCVADTIRRPVLFAMLQDHADRTLLDLRGKPAGSGHDAILSRNGVSGNLGAVHSIRPRPSASGSVAPPTQHRSNVARAIGTTHTVAQPGADVLVVWKTLSGSYVLFTSTSRS
jgi:hypothetical protein